MSTLLLLVAVAAGFVIAAFFTLVTYGVVPPDGKFVPQFCRMDRGTCMTVLGHHDARLLGVPNSLVGVLFYILVAASAVAGSGNALRMVVMIAAWIAVGSGVYLTYSLLVKIRIRCALCFASHSLNLLIALLMLIDEVRP